MDSDIPFEAKLKILEYCDRGKTWSAILIRISENFKRKCGKPFIRMTLYRWMRCFFDQEYYKQKLKTERDKRRELRGEVKQTLLTQKKAKVSSANTPLVIIHGKSFAEIKSTSTYTEWLCSNLEGSEYFSNITNYSKLEIEPPNDEERRLMKFVKSSGSRNFKRVKTPKIGAPEFIILDKPPPPLPLPSPSIQQLQQLQKVI